MSHQQLLFRIGGGIILVSSFVLLLIQWASVEERRHVMIYRQGRDLLILIDLAVITYPLAFISLMAGYCVTHKTAPSRPALITALFISIAAYMAFYASTYVVLWSPMHQQGMFSHISDRHVDIANAFGAFCFLINLGQLLIAISIAWTVKASGVVFAVRNPLEKFMFYSYAALFFGLFMIATASMKRATGHSEDHLFYFDSDGHMMFILLSVAVGATTYSIYTGDSVSGSVITGTSMGETDASKALKSGGSGGGYGTIGDDSSSAKPVEVKTETPTEGLSSEGLTSSSTSTGAGVSLFESFEAAFIALLTVFFITCIWWNSTWAHASRVATRHTNTDVANNAYAFGFVLVALVLVFHTFGLVVVTIQRWDKAKAANREPNVAVDNFHFFAFFCAVFAMIALFFVVLCLAGSDRQMLFDLTVIADTILLQLGVMLVGVYWFIYRPSAPVAYTLPGFVLMLTVMFSFYTTQYVEIHYYLREKRNIPWCDSRPPLHSTDGDCAKTHAAIAFTIISQIVLGFFIIFTAYKFQPLTQYATAASKGFQKMIVLFTFVALFGWFLWACGDMKIGADIPDAPRPPLPPLPTLPARFRDDHTPLLMALALSFAVASAIQTAVDDNRREANEFLGACFLGSLLVLFLFMSSLFDRFVRASDCHGSCDGNRLATAGAGIAVFPLALIVGLQGVIFKQTLHS